MKAFVTKGSTELETVMSGINKIYTEKHCKGKLYQNPSLTQYILVNSILFLLSNLNNLKSEAASAAAEHGSQQSDIICHLVINCKNLGTPQLGATVKNQRLMTFHIASSDGAWKLGLAHALVAVASAASNYIPCNGCLLPKSGGSTVD